ncbi:MAG: HAMP domain-containing histidine kinase [Rhodocyclaceae bacterium]|nr:HAMP domain-containing histidine kinase [Rhodocyclaceae bacterium]
MKADVSGRRPAPSGLAVRTFGRTLLLYLLPWWIALPLLAAIVHHFQSEAELARYELREFELLDTHGGALIEAMTRLNNDIRLMANVAASAARRYPPGAARRDALATTFDDFLRAHPHYAQARLLDPDCRETVRVDRRSGTVGRIADAALQDKSRRDYCERPLAMRPGQQYLSPLNANIENGRVVLPLEPTMRAAAGVWLTPATPLGVVVLNFDASDMLAGFVSSSNSRLALLNQEGYWLRSATQADEFGFVGPDPERRFSVRHPAVWRAIQDARGNRGSLAQADGLWTYRRITTTTTERVVDPPVWYAVSQIPQARIDEAHSASEYRVAGLTALGLAAASLLALALARSHVASTITAASLARSNGELKTAVDELNASRDELVRQEKLSSLGLLVAGVSHEMNTPLGAATLAATALQEQLRQLQSAYARGIRRSDLERFADDQGQGLQLLHANLERANALSRQFKQVAADRANASRHTFSLKTLVDDVLALSNNTLKRALDRVEIEVPEALQLDSYPGPLGQVVQNLVLNAAHHAFTPHQSGALWIRAEVRDDWLRLEVEDNGCGVPEENRAKIWDPFFTTRRGEGGTGLGLHICHQLVTAVLGGSIRAEAGADGKGTRVVVEIPLVAPDEPPG